jgi:hypothetical protein
LHEVPKDPVTSGNAEAGVFAYVQPYAARSGRMSGAVDYVWTGRRVRIRRWGPGNDEAPGVESGGHRAGMFGGLLGLGGAAAVCLAGSVLVA